MRKILKYILGVVIVAILLLSIIFMSSEHEYDLVEIEEVQTDENFISIKYEKEEQIEDEDILGTLTIEKIDLKAPVKEGSSQEILKEYIGHMPETSKYDGNVGLAAHNRGMIAMFAQV